jgi:CubicO group peptidase (beta-lactamase class C family)
MNTINLSKKWLAILLILPAFLSAQTIADKADSLLSAYYKQDLFTGTVLIAQGDKIVFERSYGMANREKQTKINSQTQFRIGSITKPVTAMIILQLKDKGLLKLSDPLSKYIPGIPNGDSATIEHLLNHTSGIKSLTSTERYRKEKLQIKTKQDVINILKAEPAVFSVGTKWQYSNSNFILLGYIAEQVTGKQLSTLIDEFSSRIGMKQTGLDLDARTAKNKALGYEAGAIEDYQPVPDINIDIIAGAGGMYSTARDLYKLDRALYTNSILPDSTKSQMFATRKGNYGLGWETETYKNKIELGHSGSIEGFKAQILRYPETGTCIIFLSNYFNTRGPQICEALKAIAFNEPYKLPEQRNFVKLSEKELSNYEGIYSFNGGMKMDLKASSGVLLSIIKGQPVVGFKPLSEKDFYNKSNNSQMEFIKDSNGVIKSFKLKMGKQEMEWVKVPVDNS